MSRQVNPNTDMPIMQIVGPHKVRTLAVTQANSVEPHQIVGQCTSLSLVIYFLVMEYNYMNAS